MEFRILKRFFLSSTLLLAGCNLFNPSGTGDAGDGAQGNITSGEVLYQQGKYAESMAAFSKAISEDSTKSLAYYGYAKASVGLYNISVNSILNDLDSSSNQDTAQKNSVNIPLLNHSRADLTSRLDAAIDVNKVLDILAKRDSLTRYFNYLRDTSSKALEAEDSLNDSLYHKRVVFMKGYLAKADLNTPGYYQRSQFPLTDFAMPIKNISGDYGVYKLIQGLNGTYDLNSDGNIDSAEYAFRTRLTLTSSGGGFGNADSVKSSLTDTATRNGFNNVIQNLGSSLGASSSILKQFIPTTSSTDTSSNASSSTTDNLDSIVQSLGSTIVFYQFGDKKDNDGDGCIDEEVLDSKDNDFDAFVDEDARIVAPTDTVTYQDLIDNDHNGVINDAGEAPVGKTVNSTNPQWLGFVNTFYKNNQSHPDSAWVKIRKGDANINLRIQIQNDSLTLKTPSQLATTYKPQLDSAKKYIGGCWRNY